MKSKILKCLALFGLVLSITSCDNKKLDEKDILVNEAIDEYVTNYLIEDIKDDTLEEINGEWSNFTNYWSYLVVSELKDNGYSIDIKDNNKAIYNYIKDYDLDTLSGVDFGKYYYYAKAFDINLDSYKVKYKTFLETLGMEYYDYGEYTIPFEIAPAKALEIENNNIHKITNSTYKPSTDYGYDGYNWFYTSNVLFTTKVDNDYLEKISKEKYDNPTSIALSIASFAASNVNVREEKYKTNNKDLVELLLESYDSNLKLIKYDSKDTGINYSTNQIYAGLIAYKYQRDNNKAVNIFR